MSVDEIRRAMLAPILKTDPPRVGPFAVLFDRASTSPFRNYATPAGDELPTPAELDELVGLFAAHGLRARLEYVEHDASLTDVLTRAGFSVAQRVPLMSLGEFVPPTPVPGFGVGPADGRDDLLGAAEVMSISYAAPEPAERGADRLAGTLAAGGAVSVAREPTSGRVVGAGLHTAPVEGLVEIAAVATHPEFRRRGIAASVGGDLARGAIEIGALPFLQAEGVAEARIYARLGFEQRAAMVFADGPARR